MKLSGARANSFLRAPARSCPAVLLYGEDGARVAAKARLVLENHLGPNAREDMRLDELAAAKLRSDPALLSDAISATGFFPGPRAVSVEGAGDGTLPALESAVKLWREGDALVVVTAGILPKRSKLRKFFEDHPHASAIGVYSDPPGPDDIREALHRAGFKGSLTRDAEAALLALAASMAPMTLERFTEILVLYHGEESAALGVEAIEALAPRSTDAAIDEVVDHAAAGARDALALATDRALAQGANPTGLLIAVTMRFRTMVLANAAPDAGAVLMRARPPIMGPRRDRLLRQLQGWRHDRLALALSELLSADLTLRSAGARAPAAALVSRALIRVASLRGG